MVLVTLATGDPSHQRLQYRIFIYLKVFCCDGNSNSNSDPKKSIGTLAG